jgi:hypothetical protein
MRLREFGEIRYGNCLLVPCMGKDHVGEQHCCGSIRIPFQPTINGALLAKANEDGRYWQRIGGETLDNIGFTDSINAGRCGHFTIKDGEITVRP